MKGMSIMKNYKKLAVIMSVMMFGSVAAACGGSNNENKTPHTTYSANDIENMSDDELEKALENAANEIEMSENAQEVSSENVPDAIDMWKDVTVTFDGVNDYAFYDIEYVGDNQIIKDSVQFYPIYQGLDDTSSSKGFGSAYSGSIFWIAAIYDENALNEAGVTLIKRIDTDRKAMDKFESTLTPVKEGTVDVFCYTVPELPAKWIAVTDETDMTIFNDAIEAVTKRARQNPEFTDEKSWIKDENIHPMWGAISKNDEGRGTYIEIGYGDENGNFVGKCSASEINAFYENGEWCKDVWNAIPDYSIYMSVLKVGEIINIESFEEWSTAPDLYVYFEIN